MQINRHSTKGQAIMAEQVIIFMIVVAVVGGMMVYVRRALAGRAYSAQSLMITSVRSTGVAINMEFEPHYIQSDVTTTTTSEDNSSLKDDGVYQKTVNTVREVTVGSIQRPPAEVGP